LPTKLCVAFADPERNWHGRRGWVVDIAYARLADATEDRFWNVDALAERVYQATEAGVRVLVRLEYDRDQSLPPRDDFLALSDYLSYVRRLARDDRLAGVYGYVIGSGPNAIESNAQAADRPVTAEWYARIFNGFG